MLTCCLASYNIIIWFTKGILLLDNSTPFPLYLTVYPTCFELQTLYHKKVVLTESRLLIILLLPAFYPKIWKCCKLGCKMHNDIMERYHWWYLRGIAMMLWRGQQHYQSRGLGVQSPATEKLWTFNSLKLNRLNYPWDKDRHIDLLDFLKW